MSNKNTNIKIFGEDLNKASGTLDNMSIPSYQDTNGIFLDDESYANLTQRKTGFIPNTGASSVVLNTALRQNSVFAKLLADIIGSEDLMGSSSVAINESNMQEAQSCLENFLSKINKLISGELVARASMVAQNYKTLQGEVLPISDGFMDIGRQLNRLKSTINNIQPTYGVTAVDAVLGEDYKVIISKEDVSELRVSHIMPGEQRDLLFGTINIEFWQKSNAGFWLGLYDGNGMTITSDSQLDSYETYTLKVGTLTVPVQKKLYDHINEKEISEVVLPATFTGSIQLGVTGEEGRNVIYGGNVILKNSTKEGTFDVYIQCKRFINTGINDIFIKNCTCTIVTEIK